MNYSKIYDSLISKAVDRRSKSTAKLYFEKHHITPLCIGGSNDKSNLVLLTAAEHYVAHQLLVKIYPNNNKLIYAAHAMTISSSKHVRTNKEYAWIRERFAEIVGKRHKNKVVSEKTRLKMSESAKKRCNNWKSLTHTLESKIKMSESAKKRGNNNIRYWNVKFPDGTINTVECLKDFAKRLDVSIYKLRNNKLPGYELIENMRSI